MCVDFRDLKNATVKDALCLIKIDELLDTFKGANIFSTIDLFSGYWQIAMDAESAEKTAFSTKSGHYHFNVMSFCLCNAPASFQRVMEAILKRLIWKCVVIYLDDIIVYSKTPQDHCDDLFRVLSLLNEAGFKLNKKKCLLG